MSDSDERIPYGPEERRLFRLLRIAAEKCRRIILNPPGKTSKTQSFASSRAAAAMREIDQELQAIKQSAAKVVPATMAKQYQTGVKNADKTAKQAGLKGTPATSGSLTLLSSERAKVLVRETVSDLAKGIDSMGARTRRLVRDAQAIGLNNQKINRIMAGGTLDGVPRKTLERIRQEVQQVARGGLVEVIDKNGDVRLFDPTDYADMVFQTKMAEAEVIATFERLQSRGMHYVRIIGSKSKNPCTRYVGLIYYIGPGDDPTGKHPHLRTLKGAPPFHPRCTKRVVASPAPAAAKPAPTTEPPRDPDSPADPVVASPPEILRDVNEGDDDPHVPLPPPITGQLPDWIDTDIKDETVLDGFTAIQQVHGDSLALPPAKAVTYLPADPGEQGYYRNNEIGVAETAKAPGLTAGHEHAHHILRHKFGNSAATAFELDEWRQAIRESRSYLLLDIIQEELCSASGAKGIDQVEYALEWNELFARSYAQWIATVGPSARLRAQLSIRRESHWDDSDFDLILEAFGKLFGRTK